MIYRLTEKGKKHFPLASNQDSSLEFESAMANPISAAIYIRNVELRRSIAIASNPVELKALIDLGLLEEVPAE